MSQKYRFLDCTDLLTTLSQFRSMFFYNHQSVLNRITVTPYVTLSTEVLHSPVRTAKKQHRLVVFLEFHFIITTIHRNWETIPFLVVTQANTVVA